MIQIISSDKVEKWDEYLEAIDTSDVQYMCNYLKLFADYEQGEALLCIYEDENGLVYYPFIKKSIDNTKYFDITGPYGYGGPLYKVIKSKCELARGFREEFDKYCNENNIISEFIRFHPMLDNHKYLQNHLEVLEIKKIVYVDLTKSEEEIFASYKSSNRRCIKQAIRENVEVFKDNNSFEDFKKIYEDTMDRNSATDYYYFNDSFFKTINSTMGNNIDYYYSKREDKVIATELVLYSRDFAHSYLGGTLRDFFQYKPNHLLCHEVILDCKRRGMKYYILGGGYYPKDGIFNYKLTYNPTGIRSYYVGKKIHNNSIYENLVKEIFKEDEMENVNYFPLYRYKRSE